MKMLELQKAEYIPATTGGSVRFHLIKWDDNVEPFSLKTGGNISYHSLSEGTSPHTHEFAEVCLVLSGRIGHSVNGEMEELTGGMLVFIRPSDQHSFIPLANEACELVNFTFFLELLRDLSEYLEDDFFLRRFTGPILPPVFKLSNAETEKMGLELLNINSLEVASVGLARLKIKTVLADLFTTYFLKTDRVISEPGVPPWLDELCSKMRSERNLARGLKAMQEMASCTPEHLCKSFRKYLDKSPTEFINELRVNHAARLLSGSNEEIYAIATDLGFQSLSRFYHIFKKHYGVSPGKYRVIAKKNEIPM